MSRTLRFRLALFAGLAPILLVGFLVSAIANRTIFAGWGLLVGALYVGLIVIAFRRQWSGWLTAGRAFLVAAGGAALLARLVAREYQEVDLGLQSFAPDLYRAEYTDPRNGVYAAIVLTVCGVLLILISHGAASMGRSAGGRAR